MARPIKTIALAATAAVLVALAFAEVRTACEAAARWFDPVRGRYNPIPGSIENRGTRRFVPPAWQRQY
jgi:hypothetical protein